MEGKSVGTMVRSESSTDYCSGNYVLADNIQTRHVWIKADSIPLSFFWPDKERAQWERVKTADLESARSTQVPPYTDEEKEWLKENWGGEFRFLRGHLLKIHDEEDRAEGRRIVR